MEDPASGARNLRDRTESEYDLMEMLRKNMDNHPDERVNDGHVRIANGQIINNLRESETQDANNCSNSDTEAAKLVYDLNNGDN